MRDELCNKMKKLVASDMTLATNRRRGQKSIVYCDGIKSPRSGGAKLEPSGAGSVWKGGARKRVDDVFFAISIKRRGRKANFARKESGTYRYDFCPLKGVNRREAAAPNWSPATAGPVWKRGAAE